MRWEDVNFANATVFLPKTKNGFARTIPLSSVAVKILRGLETVKQDDQTVFQIKSASHDAIFRKMKELTGLDNEDLHFCKRLNYFALVSRLFCIGNPLKTMQNKLIKTLFKFSLKRV